MKMRCREGDWKKYACTIMSGSLSAHQSSTPDPHYTTTEKPMFMQCVGLVFLPAKAWHQPLTPIISSLCLAFNFCCYLLLYTCTYVCIHLEGRCWHLASIALHFVFWGRISHRTWNSHDSVMLGSQQVLVNSCLSWYGTVIQRCLTMLIVQFGIFS